ncbi:MAG TPA: hypothetical protein PLC98_25600 [Anaerolineales bacterium]|nr:hypothetical protein [Anaerolineales bacterium]
MSKLVFVVTMALCLSSCSTADTPVAAVAILAATETIAPTNTHSPTSTAVKLTATARPSQTPEPPAVCPAAGADIPLQAPKNLVEFRETVLAYLNSGGNTQALAGTMTELGMSAEVAFADLDADKVHELIILLDYPSSPDYSHESAVWVFRCTRAGVYAEAQSFMDGLYTWEPTILAITDLTGDGHPEVVVQGTWSGSACELALAVIGASGAAIVDRISGKGMPGCPATVSIAELSSADLPGLILHGQTSTSQAGGPSRGVTYSYRWNRSEFELVDERFDPSLLRIHVLEDAQRALDSDDFDEAIRLYDLAAHDTTLENIASYYYIPYINSGLPDRDVPERYQPAFALFRLGAIYSFLAREEEFASTKAELITEYPDGTPGGEFADLLQILAERIQLGDGATIACQAVSSAIHERYPELDYHVGEWGFRNIRYVADTICPFNDP